MSRKFGVELEMNGISREKAVRVLSAIGLNIQSEGYNHIRRDYWKIVNDASVRNGFEVVSPVLDGEAGLEQLRAVVTALKDAGGTVDRSCGFHVHFDAADLSLEHLRAIVTRYAAHEAKIDAFMPPSRRGNANNYCRGLGALVGSPAFRRAANLGQLVEAQPGRYFKVNLQSHRVHGTVEFRQHSGTLDAPKAVNWVRFLAAFVEECRAKADGRAAQAAAPAPNPRPSLAGVQGRLADLFLAQTTVTLRQIAEAFGWQAHSARAAICRLRQAGYNIVRLGGNRPGGELAYTLVGHDQAGAPVAQAIPVPADDLYDGIPAALRIFYTNRATVLALN